MRNHRNQPRNRAVQGEEDNKSLKGSNEEAEERIYKVSINETTKLEKPDCLRETNQMRIITLIGRKQKNAGKN